MVDWQKGVYALFPAETIVRDSHHCKSPRSRGQELNMSINLKLEFVEGIGEVMITTQTIIWSPRLSSHSNQLFFFSLIFSK